MALSGLKDREQGAVLSTVNRLRSSLTVWCCPYSCNKWFSKEKL